MSKRQFSLLPATVVRQVLDRRTRRWEAVEPRIVMTVVSKHLKSLPADPVSLSPGEALLLAQSLIAAVRNSEGQDQ